tara:strand:- start:985 stop:1176 length:192 start_codon:yes stop_codon:yes gene_type:complete
MESFNDVKKSFEIVKENYTPTTTITTDDDEMSDTDKSIRAGVLIAIFVIVIVIALVLGYVYGR